VPRGIDLSEVDDGEPDAVGRAVAPLPVSEEPNATPEAVVDENGAKEEEQIEVVNLHED
jgi:hypothetical protein